jgi:hypothetical protein
MHKEKMMLDGETRRVRPVKFKHLQAARTAVGSSAAHAGSLATVASAAGGIALAAAATSVAAAVRLSLAVGGVPDRRAPARPPSDPPFVAAAVRGIIELQAAPPSTRHPARLHIPRR